MTQGAVGLARKNTGLIVHDPGLPEQRAGKQLQIEADHVPQLLRQRRIQIHRHQRGGAFAAHRDSIGKRGIRIEHGIDAPQAVLFIRIAELCDDGIAVPVKGAAQLPGDGLPLAGGRLKTKIPAGGHAPPVHEDAYTGLVPLGINIIKGHDVDTLVAEITPPGIQLEQLFFLRHRPTPSLFCQCAARRMTAPGPRVFSISYSFQAQ